MNLKYTFDKRLYWCWFHNRKLPSQTHPATIRIPDVSPWRSQICPVIITRLFSISRQKQTKMYKGEAPVRSRNNWKAKILPLETTLVARNHAAIRIGLWTVLTANPTTKFVDGGNLNPAVPFTPIIQIIIRPQTKIQQKPLKACVQYHLLLPCSWRNFRRIR